jgi:hypothetical protein
MKNRFLRELCQLLSASALLVACSGSTAQALKPFQVQLQAKSDDGEPVNGAKFSINNVDLGASAVDGKLLQTVRGTEGQSVLVNVSCPDEYISPEKPTPLKLTEVRKVNETASATLGLGLTCTRKMLDVIVVVRTENAPSLPVDVGGKNLGVTDEFGNAHVHLRVERGTRTVSVTLGTLAAPTLRPQNPSRVFELDDKDGLLLVEQSFTVERKRPVFRPTTPPRGDVGPRPIRIGG